MTTPAFTAATGIGDMPVTASYWTEHPDDQWRKGDFHLTYTLSATINRIEYTGIVDVAFYRPHDQTEYYRGAINPHLNRTMTDAARTQILDAILGDIAGRNLAPLIETARQTNAQYQADREIEKAQRHLARAQQWAPHMATADARHYQQGFTITSGYHESQDA